jgi:hypothetical protein
MLKYTLIAVTALSLTACVLLIALWVRSYWWSDVVGGYLSEAVTIRFHSVSGQLTFHLYPDENLWRWKWKRQSAEQYAKLLDDIIQEAARMGDIIAPQPKFALSRTNNHLYLKAPYWFLVSSFGTLATIAALPWIRWHFSLRTLLIATTLVAVGLGIVVVAMRSTA